MINPSAFVLIRCEELQVLQPRLLGPIPYDASRFFLQNLHPHYVVDAARKNNRVMFRQQGIRCPVVDMLDVRRS